MRSPGTPPTTTPRRDADEITYITSALKSYSVMVYGGKLANDGSVTTEDAMTESYS